MGKTGVEVFGLYATATSAEIALNRLIAAGYAQDDVSLLMADAYATRDTVLEASAWARYRAMMGSVIGGTLGSLRGIGSVAIPGVGPVISSGRMIGRLDTECADSITNAIASMGVPELEARHYEDCVKDGDVLLALHCESQAETNRVATILKESGGKEVADWAEAARRWRPTEKGSCARASRPEMRSH